MNVFSLAVAILVAIVGEVIVFNMLNTVGIGGITGFLLLAVLPGSFTLYVLAHR